VPKIHADGVEATVCDVKTSRREISYVAPPPDTIFIQTDKPIYKPGQKGEQLVSTQFIIGLGACISSENQALLMICITIFLFFIFLVLIRIIYVNSELKPAGTKVKSI
jgi:hypothetical protein